MAVKLFKPYVSWRAIWNVVRVLTSGQLAEGPRVKEFEAKFAEKFGFKKEHVVTVNSGTAALELAYELAGIKKGDEVITPALTCTATNIPLVHRGAKIVFADIEDDLNISVEDVRNKITTRTKAIVFVHFGGNNRGLREIVKLARERGITVIEDAAQTVGSGYWGKAEYTAVSLQAIKTLTSGDGGILLCKGARDAATARRLRWFGYDRDKKQRDGDAPLVEAGYKYHMNDISAAIGLGNLKSIDAIVEHRSDLARVYRQYGLFAHNWLAGIVSDYADEIQEDLKKMGFESGQHHFDNRKYELFSKYSGKCPNMDILKHAYLFVPYHHGVTLLDAHRIGRLIESYVEKEHGL